MTKKMLHSKIMLFIITVVVLLFPSTINMPDQTQSYSIVLGVGVDKKDGVCQKCSNENGELYCLNKYFGCVESMYENCLECNDIFNLYRCTKCYEGYEVNMFNVCVKTDKEK